nr:hypothetical protein [Tanacetum cinerariifolium]
MPRGIFSCFRHRTSTTPTTSESPDPIPIPTGPGLVLVELFTSQGCTTSPSAELLFSRIGRGDFNQEIPPVIILAYHVDYWDYNGWKDPFGSSQWTIRQKVYVQMFNLDTMFTPHVVVQGVKQCIGYDQDEVLECIKGVDRYPAPAFQATFERPTPESLQIALKGALRAKLDGVGADIMVALCESGLVTDCQDGVNKDRMLANDFVRPCTKKEDTVSLTVGADPTIGLRRENQDVMWSVIMVRDSVQLETAVNTISHEYLLEFTSEYGISKMLHPELPGPEDRIVDFPE